VNLISQGETVFFSSLERRRKRKMSA